MSTVLRALTALVILGALVAALWNGLYIPAP